MVKDELTSEEKFFEKAVVTERFVKKYKNAMIGSVVVVVLLVAGNIVYNESENSRISDANKLIVEIGSDTNNTVALSKLETLSPALHDAWLYSQAMSTQDIEALKELQNSKVLFVNDLSSYEVAQTEANVEKLNAYAQKQGSIYKDLALVQSAIILMNDGATQKAHDKLSMISATSPLSNIASALMHYGVK